MKIAEAKSKTSKKWRTHTITWEEFIDRISRPYLTPETMREYKGMTKAEKDRAKEAMGGFVGGALSGGQRKTENVVNRYLITLDADEAVPGMWESAVALHDFCMAVYSTHSHTEERPRLRWIIPTDRPMTPEEYPAVARKVASWLGIETMDPTTYEVARLMYWPTCSSDAPYFFRKQDGPLLSVGEVLEEYGDNEAWKDTSLWPIAKKENEVRIRAIKKAGDPTEKNGIVGLFCRTYDVEDAIAEFLPDVYTECNQQGRYTFAGGSTFGGAIVYDEGRFLYSNHATDPCQGMSVNAFDLVRIHKYGAMDADMGEDVPVTKLPSYKAMAEWAVTLEDIAKAQVAEGIARIEEEFGDMLEDKEADTGDKDWEKLLMRDEKTGEILETLSNAMLLVRNLPDFKGKLGYNPMTDTITVKGDLPWRERKRKLNQAHRKKKRGLEDIFTGSDDTDDEPLDAGADWNAKDWPDFYAYMEKWNFMTGKRKENGMLENAVMSVAQEREFHPIKAYLEDLEWDGIERLDTMFIRWLGAEDNELNRTVTRLWMIAAVDRIIRPGKKFDEILITTGAQGIGKTKMLQMLARNPSHFTSQIDKPCVCKETSEKLKGVWIVELGELDGVRKTEQTALKNFISTTQDQYRAAYAREAKHYPRQCVLAGTTNNGAFLRDETGERRYWILPVKGTGDRGELRGLDKEIDQLWAEAVEGWKGRMKEMREPGQTIDQVNLYLYLKDQRLEDQMEARRQMFKLPDTDRTDIHGYLETPRPENWYDMEPYDRRNFAKGDWIGDPTKCTLLINRVCIKELRYELFDGKEGKDIRIGDILDNAKGWKKGKPGRNKAYANWPMPMWVRIGSPEDPDVQSVVDDPLS